MANLPDLLLGNVFTAVELFSSPDSEKVSVVTVRKKKGELFILDSRLTGADVFQSEKKANGTVVLVINTDQILHKSLPASDAADDKILFKAFPNLSQTEFYFEVCRMHDIHIVAVARRSYVDGILEKYAANFSLAGFSLGVCGLGYLFAENPEEVIRTNSKAVSLQHGSATIEDRTLESDVTYSINGLEIKSSQLLPFSGVLKLLFASGPSGGNAQSSALYDGFLQKRLFISVSRWAIGGFLVLLLVNFFVFNHYFGKNQSLKEKNAIETAISDAIDNARKRVSAKSERFSYLNSQIDTRVAKTLNEMMRKMPASVLLDKLDYNPLTKKIKPGERIIYDENTILISGITNNNIEFTQWVRELKSIANVTSVSIVQFGKNELSQNAFALKILTDATQPKK